MASTVIFGGRLGPSLLILAFLAFSVLSYPLYSLSGHSGPISRLRSRHSRGGEELKPRRCGLDPLTLLPIDEDGDESYSDTLLAPTTTSASSSPFASFDYNSHWYPVIWACDLRLNDLTKVTVFDQDYVVARISDTEVICLQDRCPHKAAALSQGRVTSTGKLQCAYHGWSFDGKSGACVEIPQILDPGFVVGGQGGGPRIPLQSRAQAIPAQIHQEMVWIFPGGNLEQALQAPPPPSVPEFDALGYKMCGFFVRDFPDIDWSIVLSNICDPDHGLFAHQAKGFDLYSASKDHPMSFTSELFPNNGKGWILQSQVDAERKVLHVDKQWRKNHQNGNNKKNASVKEGSKAEESKLATVYFSAPCHVHQKRVDRNALSINNDNDSRALSSFVTVFHVCPVGAGKSRFMSAMVLKNQFPLIGLFTRRWQTKLFLENFLDQDTYLLATQQQYILDQEARDLKQALLKTDNDKALVCSTRRNLFCLCSPTEKFGSKLEQFWDATLWRSPNRKERLLQLQAAGAFSQTPPRIVVLDRKVQHLDICQDAQDVVRNCRRITRIGKSIGFLAFAAAIVMATATVTTPQQTLYTALRRPLWLWFTCGLSLAVSRVANSIRKEYYFKYTDDLRRRDMNKIPKEIWADK
ncbi:hypothetical protein ACA910_020985 [Epithemia clementina (nom. ined.)]